MKYILFFILLNCTAFADYIDNVQAHSFYITYKSVEQAKKDDLIIFYYYTDENEAMKDNKTLPMSNIPVITKTIDLSKMKPNKEGVYILGKNNGLTKFTVTGLKAKSFFTLKSYSLESGKYKKLMTIRTSSLAEEPKENPTDIIFKNTSTDHLYITWKEPNSPDGILLLVSKDKKPTPPSDGVIYKANHSYGSKGAFVGGTTYAVYSGKKQFADFIKIDSLDYGTYYFQAYSYNGELGNINYNIKGGQANPRSVTMKLPPPILDEDSEFLEQTFEIKWSKVVGATTYEVQAAYDPDFLTFVENYNTVDVGNTIIYEIVTSDPDKEMYVRVRAKNGRNVSDWSNIIEVED